MSRIHEWVMRVSPRWTERRLLLVGWLASGVGLALLLSLWQEGNRSLIDWLGGLVALSGRPYAGLVISHAKTLTESPPQ